MTARGWLRRSKSGSSAIGRLRAPGVSIAIVVAALVAGCSGLSATASPTTTPTTTPTGLASPTDSLQGGPAPTNWPTTVVDGVIGLAGADTSFKQMNADVATAVNSADPRTIVTVMNDALKFLRPNLHLVAYLQGYGPTKDTGDKLSAAYNQMINGAQAIVDGASAGDGEAVQQGFDQFFAGDAAYAAQTGPLSDLAQQALLMRRNLTE